MGFEYTALLYRWGNRVDMFIHDIIKIHLVQEGYLPDYPYHLISDEEMCDAFLPYVYDEADPYAGYTEFQNASISFFKDNYPLIHPQLEDEYKLLVSEIAWHLNQLKQYKGAEYKLPYWVYSYMLGSVLGPNSDILDLHDLFVLLGTDNLYDEFTVTCARACYDKSVTWLKKLPTERKLHRPPTIFGEPHVIKACRLQALDSPVV